MYKDKEALILPLLCFSYFLYSPFFYTLCLLSLFDSYE